MAFSGRFFHHPSNSKCTSQSLKSWKVVKQNHTLPLALNPTDLGMQDSKINRSKFTPDLVEAILPELTSWKPTSCNFNIFIASNTLKHVPALDTASCTTAKPSTGLSCNPPGLMPLKNGATKGLMLEKAIDFTIPNITTNLRYKPSIYMGGLVFLY